MTDGSGDRIDRPWLATLQRSFGGSAAGSQAAIENERL
jgi:hypothetical protein